MQRYIGVYVEGCEGGCVAHIMTPVAFFVLWSIKLFHFVTINLTKAEIAYNSSGSDLKNDYEIHCY